MYANTTPRRVQIPNIVPTSPKGHNNVRLTAWAECQETASCKLQQGTPKRHYSVHLKQLQSIILWQSTSLLAAGWKLKGEHAAGWTKWNRTTSHMYLIYCVPVKRSSPLLGEKTTQLKLQVKQFRDNNSLDSSSPAALNLLIWGLSHSDKASGLYPGKKRNGVKY